jgi:hypothetical protein
LGEKSGSKGRLMYNVSSVGSDAVTVFRRLYFQRRAPGTRSVCLVLTKALSYWTAKTTPIITPAAATIAEVGVYPIALLTPKKRLSEVGLKL